MKREDIWRLAIEAGYCKESETLPPIDGFLERFAALCFAAGAERMKKEAVKVCNSEKERALFNFQNDVKKHEEFWRAAEVMAYNCFDDIRAIDVSKLGEEA